MNGIPTSASPPIFYFKASRQPALWAAVAYSLGIIAGAYLWRPILWWVVAGAAFVAAAAYFAGPRARPGWSLALGAVFVTGGLPTHARGASQRRGTPRHPYADRQELQIAAHVTRDGRLQQGGFNEIRQTIDVETEEVQTLGYAFCGRSSIIAISAVSSSSGADRRPSAITRRAASASSSRTKRIIPPKPGNASCTMDAEVRLLSMPAESSNPLTNSASGSCSEPNTFTSFSLGSGRGCASAAELPGSAMTSPILESNRAAPTPLHSDFTPLPSPPCSLGIGV